MRRHLSMIALLLVGCASGPPAIRVFATAPAPGVAAVSSPVPVASIRPRGAAMGMTVEGVGLGEVQLVVEDEATVQVCWGPALALGRAYLRVELLQHEAHFEEHRPATSDLQDATMTVSDPFPLRAFAPRPHVFHHHVILTLQADGGYEARLLTNSVSSDVPRTDVQRIDSFTAGRL